ncbi:ogr/Delta-like zinc finger family protein [Pseudomonas sp. zjy_8]
MVPTREPWGRDAVRIVCRECRSRARISSQNELSVDYTNLYCLCLECGHQSVMNLAYPPPTPPGRGAKRSISCCSTACETCPGISSGSCARSSAEIWR